jgi:hypothetical protein
VWKFQAAIGILGSSGARGRDEVLASASRFVTHEPQRIDGRQTARVT